MSKYYETTHHHPFRWSHLAESLFRRYPNPFSTHVLSEDVIHRSVLPDGSLYTRRFLTKTNKLPKYGERILAGVIKRYVPLVEESIVDPAKKEIVTYTRNVGLCRFMSAVEKVRYVVSPGDNNACLAIKEAWIESSLYGLRSAVKNYGLKRFQSNCTRATEGFNHVMRMRQNLRDRMKATSIVRAESEEDERSLSR